MNTSAYLARAATDPFEAQLEAQLSSLYSMALRYTRDASLAEDLVHDTAVRALRFRDKFMAGTNFKAWVYTILTNTFIHRYRRQRREREILEGQNRADVEQQMRSETSRELAQNPERGYLHQALSDDVVRALESLPEEFRTVVMLCDVEGQSYKDIAELLMCPLGTIMSRLYRARRLLERKLAHVAVENGILKDSPSTLRQLPLSIVDRMVASPKESTVRRRRHG
jgi:RNA polymerase sigma-70 factor (ECF subfamily)